MVSCYYCLIIECCLELMHLRSSILLLVIVMDDLRVIDDHFYATRHISPHSLEWGSEIDRASTIDILAKE